MICVYRCNNCGEVADGLRVFHKLRRRRVLWHLVGSHESTANLV
jgi:hypothetical protein